MPSNTWAHGIGETTGDAILTANSFMSSGAVIYVDSVNGSDVNSGLDRIRPLQTLGAAVTAAATNPNLSPSATIVLLPGHDEILTSSISLVDSLLDGLTIVGSGIVGGKPAARLRAGLGISLPMITVSVGNVTFGNIWFGAHAVAMSAAKLYFEASESTNHNPLVRDCLFEMGDTDNGTAVILGPNFHYGKFLRCRFNSVATGPADQPLRAISQATASTNLGWRMEDVSFDGGASGFSNFYAVDTELGTEFSGFQFERISLLHGADIRMSSANEGKMTVVSAESGGYIRW